MYKQVNKEMDIEERIEKTLDLLGRWKHNGEKINEYGVQFICPAPYIAPKACLHILYKALADKEIDVV